MNILTTKEINEALLLKDKLINETEFTGVSIDTRTIKKGNLFIPIKGKNYDGHNFIGEALKKGAYASLVEFRKKQFVKYDKRLIFVKSTIDSLHKLAMFSRNRIKDLIIICVTGSSGKTTLKEWIFKTLKGSVNTYRTIGNFNNEIGMPLSLVNMPRDTKICVLEIGMNSPGEIKRLSKIAKPNVGIITNIGSAHVANFENTVNIAKEKSDIFCSFDEESIAIIPFETSYYNLISKKALKKTKKVYSFGKNKSCDFRIITREESVSKLMIIDKEFNLKNNQSFINWEQNIVIILGLLRILKIKIKNIMSLMMKLGPIEGRGKKNQISYKNKSFTLIDESYNSNPESLAKAIENLENLKSNHTRIICVIGDMLELGKMSRPYHLRIVKILLKTKPHIIFTVGKYSNVIFKKLPENFLKFHFENYRNVFDKLLSIIENDDIIMIKGSNSTNLHLVSKKLIELG